MFVFLKLLVHINSNLPIPNSSDWQFEGIEGYLGFKINSNQSAELEKGDIIGGVAVPIAKQNVLVNPGISAWIAPNAKSTPKSSVFVGVAPSLEIGCAKYNSIIPMVGDEIKISIPNSLVQGYNPPYEYLNAVNCGIQLYNS